MSSIPTADNASFRDPDSAVFRQNGRVFRGLRDSSWAALQSLQKSGLIGELETAKKIVRTDFHVNDAESLHHLNRMFPGYNAFVEHPELPFITHPCEWTASMLCDAALLHLELQLQLLKKGFSLKDASAYNVQFDGSREIFIDLGSFEQGVSALWPAYGQFCRMFLFPLLLNRFRKIETKGLFLSHLDGVPLKETAEMLGLKIFHPSCWLDVFLPHQFEKRAGKSTAAPALQAEGDARVQMVNVERLARLVRGLRARAERAADSAWADYQGTRLYTEAEVAAKKRFVARFMEQHKPKTVLDAGANTGEFSVLAAKGGARVTAVDSDHDSLDVLYRKARQEHLSIQPVWMSLDNPTPAYGFLSDERRSFNERAGAEAVFALALLHHLIVTGGIPLERAADMLWSFSSRALIVEYVSPDDPQFKSLIGFRRRSYADLTEARVIEAFSRHGELVTREAVTPLRTLLLFSRK